MRSELSGERIAARIVRVRRTPIHALLLALPLCSGAAFAQGTLQDLGKLPLQDLGKIVVTSVAKHPESLGDAPAAVYVITHDEIMRSGAQTLPERGGGATRDRVGNSYAHLCCCLGPILRLDALDGIVQFVLCNASL